MNNAENLNSMEEMRLSMAKIVHKYLEESESDPRLVVWALLSLCMETYILLDGTSKDKFLDGCSVGYDVVESYQKEYFEMLTKH